MVRVFFFFGGGGGGGGYVFNDVLRGVELLTVAKVLHICSCVPIPYTNAYCITPPALYVYTYPTLHLFSLIAKCRQKVTAIC